MQYDEDVIKNQILVVSDLNDQYNGEFTKQEQRLKGALKKLVNKTSTVINGNVTGDVISDGGTKNQNNYDTK